MEVAVKINFEVTLSSNRPDEIQTAHMLFRERLSERAIVSYPWQDYESNEKHWNMRVQLEEPINDTWMKDAETIFATCKEIWKHWTGVKFDFSDPSKFRRDT